MCDPTSMLLYHTEKEMMLIHISSKEARDLERYFNITLPKNNDITAQTVMKELRLQTNPHTDVQLLKMFAAALKELGIKERRRKINALAEVMYFEDKRDESALLQLYGTEELSHFILFFAASQAYILACT